MNKVHLLLLGSPRVERDGTEVALTLRRGLALLAYLALTGRAQRREALAALLWPDTDEREARGRLRRTMYLTGEQLGVAPFAAEGDAVGLDPDLDVWVDARELERSLTADLATQRAAAALYRGELLTGLSLQESPAWEDWLELERERMRQVAGQVLQRLAAAERETQEWEAALGHGRQWLGLDPLQEAAHRLLMRLYAESGQAAAALRQYRQCARLLQAELEVEPEPETTELYELIRTRRLGPALARTAATAGADQPAAVQDDIETGPERGTERPIPPPTHNLPSSLAMFVGREQEQREVAHALAETRLLTLTGPGGIGKTRLALELARAEGSARFDETWLVELAPLAQASEVPGAVAAALRIADSAGQPLIETLVRALVRRRLLLVLDNCEHVIEGCAMLADAIIRRCPHVTILATSREPLGLSWEAIWPVQPLGLPTTVDSPADIAGAEAVQLFVSRAKMLRPSFILGDANAPEVAEICRRLDGIPLALELAAARLRVLSPRQILERLDDRFRLLTGGERAAPARQQTLAATIAWSHHLLTEPEKVFFRRLAVFAGGWTLEAAEAVCCDAELPGERVLDLLASLVDKSLVVADVRNELPRYRYLDTIRAYAQERLAESGELEIVRARHRAWVFALLQDIAFLLYGPDETEWTVRLDLEIDNIRAALEWSSTDPLSAGEALERCGFTLYRYWEIRVSVSEARQIFERLLSSAFDSGRVSGIAQGQAFLAYFMMLGGEIPGALEHIQIADDLSRSLEDRWARFNVVLMSTIIHGLTRQLEALPALCEEGSQLSAALGHPFGRSPWTFWLGELACAQGRLDEGELLLMQTRSDLQAMGNLRELNTVTSLIARVALVRDDPERASRLYQLTLRDRYAAGDGHVVSATLDGLAWVAAATGDAERAALLLGAAQAAAEGSGVVLFPIWQAERERAHRQTREALGDQRYQEQLDRGRALPLDQAVQLALS